MKKILIVFGTRPEAIKMAPLIKEIEKNTEKFITKVCITAQHRQMLDQVLRLFKIEPDYDLNIMKNSQDLYDITSNVLIGMRDVLEDFKPDLVFVHGDTTTTFSATLSAFYKRVEVAHIEAGLRTNNIYSPWPEEANRLLTSKLAKYHFAPTIKARDNLLKEGVEPKNIVVTGNTVIDALFLALSDIKSNKEVESKIIKAINSSTNSKRFDVLKSKFILVTGHRRENQGKRFENICLALKLIALKNPDIDLVYPLHLNPNIQKPARRILSGIKNIHLIEPLEYEHFIYLMDRAYFILTDSGGIQEEAPSLGKPVLLMRDTTERPEALEAKTVKLVGANIDLITKEAQKLLDDKSAYEAMSRAINPYGDGKASKRIIEFLKLKLD